MNEKYQYFNGIKFTRDDKTGYYLNSTLRIRMHRYVWEYYNGEIPKGYHIHHIDGNKANNDISNLQLLSMGEHESYHCKKYYEDNKEKCLQHLDEIRDLTKEWHKSEEGSKWHKEHYEKMKDKLYIPKKYICEQCGKEFESTKVGSRFCCNNCKSKWRREQGLDNEERECVVCGNKFITNKYSKTKTCSRSCSCKLGHKNKGGEIDA